MDGEEWAQAIGAAALGTLVVATVLTIIIQVARTMRARAVLAGEGQFRQLAETAVQTQQGIERQLTELASRIAVMESRMTSLERVLKEVE